MSRDKRNTEIFNPDEFLGSWKVIVGDIGPVPKTGTYAEIETGKTPGEYELYSASQNGRLHLQTLIYAQRTRTLEGISGGVYRSISFWDGEDTRKDRIFAMRTTKGGADPSSVVLADWENKADSDGSWGAEDG